MNVTNIIHSYNDGESVHTLAKKHGTYPTKIFRILKKAGVTLRNKSDAQKQALKVGRSQHPTEGTTRSDDVKDKISETLCHHWETADKSDIIAKAKARWAKLSPEKKKEMHKLGIAAVRESSKNGSKLEISLREDLVKNGYRVDFHKKHFMVDTRLEIDLVLPELGIAIEINGPSHFLPIWGEKSLKRQMKADTQKYGIVLSTGFKLIIIKHLKWPIPRFAYSQLLNNVLLAIKDDVNKHITIEA